MADRPRDGDPEAGTPDYHWLYGKRGQAGGAPGPRDPRPDETRVMPAQSRETQSRQPQPRATPPRRTHSQEQPRAPRPRRRFRLRWLLVALLLWLVFLVAVPFFAWTKVTKVDFVPDAGNRPGDQPGTTYLLVGSDSRADLSDAERKELGTGAAKGQRTDTIMVLHTGSGPNLLMSIPRDSLVEVPGQGTTKINAAFALGGPKLLTRTIESSTGIRIDHYVEIGFGGFVENVDAVGGVEICPETAMQDKLANLDIKKGCQEADGKTALGYARSRKTDAQYGDIGRAAHQREVVSAIGKKVLSPWTVLNPVRYWSLNMAATRAVAFGEGTNPVRAAMWATAMTRVNGENGLTCGVPIADLTVRWDEERSRQMFTAIIKDDTDSIGPGLCTPTGFPQ